MSRREVGLAEIRRLIRVVELQVEGLGDLIICIMASIDARQPSDALFASLRDVPSLLPAARKKKTSELAMRGAENSTDQR